VTRLPSLSADDEFERREDPNLRGTLREREPDVPRTVPAGAGVFMQRDARSNPAPPDHVKSAARAAPLDDSGRKDLCRRRPGRESNPRPVQLQRSLYERFGMRAEHGDEAARPDCRFIPLRRGDREHRLLS